MTRYAVELDGTWAQFRQSARGLLAHGIPADRIDFRMPGDRATTLFEGLPAPTGGTPPALPRAFMDLARRASAYDTPDRWSLVYRLAQRISHNRALLEDPGDDDVLRLQRRAKHVARDIHKMHAFVRFRPVQDDQGEIWVAFHRPDHFIIEHATPHFERRFGDARFLIATPKGTALHVPGDGLSFGPPAKDPGHDAGEFENLWNIYYANIYNPSRTMTKAMCAEMPRKHWQTMPETRLIPELLRRRAQRVVSPSEGVSLPDNPTLANLARAIRDCGACSLSHGRPGCPGEGAPGAPIAIVGDLPHESGRPFAGPGGTLLHRALRQAGVSPEQVFVTTVIKHHERAEESRRTTAERCRPFVLAELQALQPRVVVALGPLAAQTLLGKVVPTRRHVGETFDSRFGPVLVGPHPAQARPAPSDTHLVETLRRAAAVVNHLRVTT